MMFHLLRLSTRWRPWFHALVLSLCLNALFVALLFTSTLMPRETIVQRVRDAFAAGDLTDHDYLPYDTKRGWHQYNDCNILQMITNSDSSLVGRALGPRTYSADPHVISACGRLRELLADTQRSATFSPGRYTRYWHGYIPPISALLVALDLATVRNLLRGAVYSSLLLLLLSGLWTHSLFPIPITVAAAGALFWGVPYFGQGLSHALGDFAVMIGLSCLVFSYQKLKHPATLIPFCTMFGAVVVYFEMLTGPLPTAAGLLFPTVYLISRVTTPGDTALGDHFKVAIVALIAFTLGATLTFAARIAVAASFVQPSGLEVIVVNINLYMQPVSKELPVPGFLQPLGRLIRQGAVLTYGSSWGLVALYTSTAIAWIISIWLAWKHRSPLVRSDVSAFVIGAGSIPLWTLLLPTHTFVHAPFMTRILIVPISLGWAALFWQLWLRRTCNPSSVIVANPSGVAARLDEGAVLRCSAPLKSPQL